MISTNSIRLADRATGTANNGTPTHAATDPAFAREEITASEVDLSDPDAPELTPAQMAQAVWRRPGEPHRRPTRRPSAAEADAAPLTVPLTPDLRAAFPTPESVVAALRFVARLSRETPALVATPASAAAP